jgi:NAD(P)-dependent dehydrogenase (short-subunit alcohol dehydrogenase family)
LLERTLGEMGRIDVWVNNAGVAPAARLDLLETTPESWDRVVGINLRGPFFLTQAVARVMLDLVAAGRVRQPQIIFVTSVSSTFASVNRADYCVSKAGLSMVVQLFAARLAEQGINVYEVRPGVIATDMTGPVQADYDRRIREGLTPIRRWGQPADVGRAVAALACGALAFSTGEVIHVDGGLHLRRL